MALKKGTGKAQLKDNTGSSRNRFIIPVGFPNVISSVFNAPRNYSFAPNRLQLHEGMDFAPISGYSGDLPVISAAAGRVIAVRTDPRGYGNYAVVDHQNGFQTLYAHMSNIVVRVGDILTQGQRIGTAGNTGNSSGTHLHFNVIDTTRSRGNYVYGGVVDPNDFLSQTARALRNITNIQSPNTTNIKGSRKPPNQDIPPINPNGSFFGLSNSQAPVSSNLIPVTVDGNTSYLTPQQYNYATGLVNQNVGPNTVSTPADLGQYVERNTEPITAGIFADFNEAVTQQLDKLKEDIEKVMPYVMVGIIAIAVIIISAYKFIKE